MQAAFEEACASGEAGFAGFCLVHGCVDADTYTGGGSDTVLTAAARRGDVALVRVLAAAGKKVNVNCPTRASGSSALAVASGEGHAEVVRALLAVDGVDVNHTTTHGWTALMLACDNGHAEVVRALLAVAGIDVNHVTPGGSSALKRAAANWHVGCVRALVGAKGIDLNLASEIDGHTALHLACVHRYLCTARVETVELLLTAGGCRFRRTHAGNTPLDMEAGDVRVVEVFASGVDYWQRLRHWGHGWGMKEAVLTVLLGRQRVAGLDAGVCLPEELWLMALTYLRSADFMPAVRVGG